MLKKATSFLSKLSTFCIIVFIICFIIIRLDIMPDAFADAWLWTGFIAAGVTLLFIISVLILTLKEKKLQTDFGFVVTCFLDAVFISFAGWFVYMVLNTPIF